jgi:probable F420-dependent oxidoreductase
VKLGLFLPVSGRAATRKTLTSAAQQAEAWGFDSIWAADRIVIPWRIETPYAYNESAVFFVPPDRPFLESLTTMAFLAGCTERVRLGVSVVVLPYRNPLYWAKVATTIDALSGGRFVLGVGIGWMEEEFAALGAPFEDRAAVADEQLEIWNVLMRDERCSFDGRFHSFREIGFLPKAFGDSIPVWVGGESRAARRRTARFGDAWFPYFVRVTPEELRSRFDDLRRLAADRGRDPDEIELNCCLPVEVTDEPLAEPPADALKGSPEQLAEALGRFAAVGVRTAALQFMAPRYPERLAQIERFAVEVLPELAR